MENPSPIRRLTLVPAGGDETMRRYRLARLDELALATPPYEPDGRSSSDAGPNATNADRPPEMPN